jgi:hypothetical protein
MRRALAGMLAEGIVQRIDHGDRSRPGDDVGGVHIALHV